MHRQIAKKISNTKVLNTQQRNNVSSHYSAAVGVRDGGKLNTMSSSSSSAVGGTAAATGAEVGTWDGGKLNTPSSSSSSSSEAGGVSSSSSSVGEVGAGIHRRVGWNWSFRR